VCGIAASLLPHTAALRGGGGRNNKIRIFNFLKNTNPESATNDYHILIYESLYYCLLLVTAIIIIAVLVSGL
jgi:hypothetical protein